MSLQKKNQNSAAAAARDLKQRVLSCLHKLSDRDTHAAAALELEHIARSLSADTLPSFISAVTATDSTDKSSVRKQCLNLISHLAIHHGNALAPYLFKLLSAILRRLRDQDSAIRSSCVTAATAIATNVTKPSFSSMSKPFLEALFTETELNSQIGTAMCLSAITEAAPEPDLVLLRKMMGRFEKLVKCEVFKAKAAVLALIGSVVEVGAVAGSMQILGNLMPCLMDFLSSEDWAARKAASEALIKLAVVEKEALTDFKAASLKTFEAKRFDKVKVVRETMNQMLEVWKEVPDASDEESLPPESQASTKGAEIGSDGRYPLASRTSCTNTANAPQARKKLFSNKSILCDGSAVTTARKRSSLNGTDGKIGSAMFRKLDRKKPAATDVSVALISKDNPQGRDEKYLEKGEDRNRFTKAEAKRTLFGKSGSRVAPCQDEKPESTVVVSNETGDILRNHKESEDLSLIRKQLVQIEAQQSNLMDLLQKFMGSSQTGMRSLETRVHGLELALDEISFDLAMSTGRMSRSGSAARTTCCLLPGAEFFSSKLWRKTEGRSAAPRFTASSRTQPVAASLRNVASRNVAPKAFLPENKSSRIQGGHAVIVNPLANIPSDSQGISDVSSSRMLKNVQIAV